MFYRSWAGLPKDPHYPSDLKELGYFVHKSDEIRSIEDENNYFKYFIRRNTRYNERQKYAMNEACEKLVHERLEKLGLKKTLLPLGTTDISEPHVPIFVSGDIKEKSRVVLVIGETYQDLGIIAHRVLSGKGGVDKGSMVSVVKALQKQPSSPEDPSPPGFIIANPGQFIWMPDLKRCVTMTGAEGAPMPSAVHAGIKWDGEKDRVPDNKNHKEHLAYIFEKVVPAYVKAGAGIDVVAVGDSADALERYLDWAPTWEKLAHKINCLAIVGGFYSADNIECEAFRLFLRQKTRAYATSTDPLGTLISGPDGNPNTATFTGLGCHIYGGGEEHFTETLLIACLPHLTTWLGEVTLAGKGQYMNADITVSYADPVSADESGVPDWSEHQEGEQTENADVEVSEADSKPVKEASGVHSDDEKDEDLDEDRLAEKEVQKMEELMKGMMNGPEKMI